jgi:hypothetical protein
VKEGRTEGGKDEGRKGREGKGRKGKEGREGGRKLVV